MDVMELREKLHEYIETADEQHLSAIYTLVGNSISSDSHENHDYVFDEETLQMLNERVAKYERGETKTYTAEESIERARQALKKK
jgi:hypothetical protein